MLKDVITNKRRGISLVFLVVVIIIMLILSGTVIITVLSDSPIGEANEAALRTDIQAMKDKYEIVYNDALFQNVGDERKLKDSDFEGVVPDDYKDQFKATKDGLEYIGDDEQIKEIADEMGLGQKDVNIIEWITAIAKTTSVEIETVIKEGEVVDEYIYQIREKGETEWKEFSSTENKLTIEDLKENTEYEVKVIVKQNDTEYESEIKTVVTKVTNMGTLTMKLNDATGEDYVSGTWTNQNVYVEVEGENTTYTVTGANTVADTTAANTLTGEGISTITLKTTSGTTVNTEEYIVKIDRSLPVINEVTLSNTAMTNEEITITAKAIDTSSGIVAYQFSTDSNIIANSNGWNEITSTTSEITQIHEIAENGTYYFYVMDDAGNVVKREIVVDNIDKNAPTDTAPTLTSTSNSITAIVKQTDESGIENGKIEVAIKKSDEDTWSEWVEIDSDSHIFENLDADTSYDVKTRVTDEAGNTTESEVSTIKTVKLEKPIITVPDTSWTNDSVDVTITYPSTSGVTREYSTDGTTWVPVTGTEVTIQVTENNTTVYSKITDSTGQTSETATYTVTCIDKDVPVINSLEASTDKITNQAITLTGKAIDSLSGIVAYQFSTDPNITESSNGWNEITNATSEITQTHEITENGTYYFYVKDAAGNVTKKEIVVDNIDITAPTLDSINVTSPATGEYPAGQEITIVATYSENIIGTAPELKIKFGISEERTISTGTISNNTITYTYTIQGSDYGVLASTSYTGSVTDENGNSLTVSNMVLGGNTITAKTESIIKSWAIVDNSGEGPAALAVDETLEAYSDEVRYKCDTSSAFHKSEYSNSITKAIFKDNLLVPDTAVISWDVSEAGNGSVMAYVEDDGNDGYILTIGGDGKVYANPDSRFLFYFLSSLTEIQNINLYDTSKATNMEGMFEGCESLTNIDLSSFDTSNVTDMGGMFYDCYSLTSLDLSKLDTSNVANMSNMFSYCSNLTSLNLTNFETNNVTTMIQMFSDCYQLTALDLSSFDTSNVTDMSSMFYNCNSLTSLDLSNFDTSNVTNMGALFYLCTGLQKLNLSSFDTSQVTYMNDMFNTCNYLLEVTLGEKFAFLSTGSRLPTPNSRYIVGADGNWYNVDTGVGYAPANVPNNTAATYTAIAPQAFAVYSAYDNSLSFYKRSTVPAVGDTYNGKIVTTVYTGFENTSYSFDSRAPWTSDYTISISSVVVQDKITPVSTAYWFYELNDCSTMDLSNLDTSSVTDMNNMFAYCRSLGSINVSGWNTSQVTDMNNMFCCCSGLESLDISNFDTSNVTNMAGMFASSGLTSLDISNFNTSKVTDMNGMFASCGNLINLDISSFDTSNVTNMSDMFFSMSNLQEVKLGANFAFVGTNGYLPTPSTTYITGADGNWYNVDTGVGYAPANVPNNTAATYTAIAPQAFAVYSVYDNSLSFYKRSTVPVVGAIYNGKIVTTVYTGIENTSYSFDSRAPWTSDYTISISSVVVQDKITPVSTAYWFYELNDCSTMNLSNLDTSNVTDMNNMFAYCRSLESINVSGWNTSQVTDMNNMFCCCSGLESLDISNFDTSNVTNMAGMFASSGLTSLDISNFNTSKVTDMNGMFAACGNLINLDVSSFDTSKVTDMSYMFNSCSSLTSLDINSFDTSKVTNMAGMFNYCNNLISLNISSFDTSKVTDMNGMFGGMSYLQEAKLGANFAFVGTNGYLPTPSTTYITGADGKWYNVDTGVGYAPANIPNNTAATYTAIAPQAFAVYSADDTSLSFYKRLTVPAVGDTYNGKTVTTVYTGFENIEYSSYSRIPWYSNRTNVTSVTVVDEITPISTAYWFYDFSNCASIDLTKLNTSNTNTTKQMFLSAGYNTTSFKIDGLNGWDTSKVTNMNQMFTKAGYSATTFDIGDLGSWNTSSVTDMSNMFNNAGRNATTFDIGDFSGWDTSSVTDMHGMFSGAGNNATTFDIGNLSEWDTSKVTDMSYMFNGAGRNATTFDIGDLNEWDTSKVTDMRYMFYYAGYSSTTFDIGNLGSWNTSSVTNMNHMFYSAGYSATTFNIGDLSGWDTSSVTNMDSMFRSAGYKATTFDIGDLSEWDTSSVTDMSVMFYETGYKATTFNIGDLSGWNTSKVTKMNYMFYSAGYSATTFNIGDLNEWDTSSVTDMYGMFYDAGRNATTFDIGDLSEWDTSSVTNMGSMFSGAGYNATTFDIGDLSEWDTSKVTNMRNMFYFAGYKATTFDIGNLGSWDTSSVTDMSYMFYYAGDKATYYMDLSGWTVTAVTSYTNFNTGVTSKVIAPSFGT